MSKASASGSSPEAVHAGGSGPCYVPDREGNDEYVDARDTDYEFGRRQGFLYGEESVGCGVSIRRGCRRGCLQQSPLYANSGLKCWRRGIRQNWRPYRVIEGGKTISKRGLNSSLRRSSLVGEIPNSARPTSTSSMTPRRVRVSRPSPSRNRLSISLTKTALQPKLQSGSSPAITTRTRSRTKAGFSRRVRLLKVVKITRRDGLPPELEDGQRD